MGYTDGMSIETKQRIVQELVPGKQITLAHIIANPDISLYESLGINVSGDSAKGAIGVITVTPPETTIIISDIALKAAGIKIEFLDRFSGSIVLTGTVSEVEVAVEAVVEYVGDKLGFEVCEATRT